MPTGQMLRYRTTTAATLSWDADESSDRDSDARGPEGKSDESSDAEADCEDGKKQSSRTEGVEFRVARHGRDQGHGSPAESLPSSRLRDSLNRLLYGRFGLVQRRTL